MISHSSPQKNPYQLPGAIQDSVHKKKSFKQKSIKSRSPLPVYSKGDLLRLIMDNEDKSHKLKNASPMIDVNEQIFGTYKTQIQSNGQQNQPAAIPLGSVNDTRLAK